MINIFPWFMPKIVTLSLFQLSRRLFMSFIGNCYNYYDLSINYLPEWVNIEESQEGRITFQFSFKKALHSVLMFIFSFTFGVIAHKWISKNSHIFFNRCSFFIYLRGSIPVITAIPCKAVYCPQIQNA
jgi:hypothetical protein